MRSRLGGLVPLLLSNPFLTASRVARELQVSGQGARNLIREAATRGWLEELGPRGRGGQVWWLARDVYETVEAPPKW